MEQPMYVAWRIYVAVIATWIIRAMAATLTLATFLGTWSLAPPITTFSVTSGTSFSSSGPNSWTSWSSAALLVALVILLLSVLAQVATLLRAAMSTRVLSRRAMAAISAVAALLLLGSVMTGGLSKMSFVAASLRVNPLGHAALVILGVITLFEPASYLLALGILWVRMGSTGLDPEETFA